MSANNESISLIPINDNSLKSTITNITTRLERLEISVSRLSDDVKKLYDNIEKYLQAPNSQQ